MKIKQIEINDIGGIKNATIKFKDGVNIICGYNGVGKTTILNCIAHSFTSGVRSTVISRNSTSEEGSVSSLLYQENKYGELLGEKEFNFKIKHFNPDEDEHFSAGHIQEQKLSVINLGIDRFLKYVKVKAIPSDTEYTKYSMDLNAVNGATTNDFKSWFLNRYLYSKHEGSLEDFQIENLKFAIKCFSILDDGFSFKRVKASGNEIMVNTPTGEIFFEYLSSGFKSCLSILFSIIKEIEFCLKDNRQIASDFDGVILIDEPEIHLHPSWQYKIKNILTSAFPNAQFICASHSPYVVQSCNSDEVITLINKDGFIELNEQISDAAHGFQGWTIEEVLDDVMGMPDARTQLYKSKVSLFYQAIDDADKDKAKVYFSELDAILHPSSMDRKIFKLDLALLTGGDNDKTI